MSDRQNPVNNNAPLSNADQQRLIAAYRRRRSQVRRRNFVITLVVILLLAVLGHVIYCIVKHINGEDVCPTCGDVNCVCSDYDYGWHDDGECHGYCPIHCSDCKHTSTYQEEDWDWDVVGTKKVCMEGTACIHLICRDCGEVLDSYPNSDFQQDTEHDFGGDRTCDDCGYKKPSQSGSSNQSEPTAKPTKKPSQSEPTAKPTKKPSQPESTPKPTKKPSQPESTPKPTKKPSQPASTPKPTKKPSQPASTPKPAPTECPHSFNGRTCVYCGYKRPVQSGSATADGEVPSGNNSWTYEDGEAANPVD